MSIVEAEDCENTYSQLTERKQLWEKRSVGKEGEK